MNSKNICSVFRKLLAVFCIPDDFEFTGVAKIFECFEKAFFSQFFGDAVTAGAVAVLFKAGNDPCRDFFGCCRSFFPLFFCIDFFDVSRFSLLHVCPSAINELPNIVFYGDFLPFIGTR